MSRSSDDRNPAGRSSFLLDVVKDIKLAWNLLHDPHLSWPIKAIPLAAVIYVLSPIDLVPDPILGLGQLDDLAILLLGIKLLIDLSPKNIVSHYLQNKVDVQRETPDKVDYIDADYQVLHDDK